LAHTLADAPNLEIFQYSLSGDHVEISGFSLPLISSKSELKEKKIDIILSAGGDGTMLRAALFSGDSGIPLLGINLGRLGFLP
jgi:NAD kinase